MIADRKIFFTGFGLIIGFFIVLIVFFSPILDGKNCLDYLDNLYNSISKGSAYYIPKVMKETDKFAGRSVSVTLDMGDKKHAEQAAELFEAGAVAITVTEARIKVTGDLGKILENCLADADLMYHNNGEKISGKYGYDERQAIYNWWKVFKEMDNELKRQKKFREAEIVSLVMKKALEPSYNYYKIQPQKISDRWGIVIVSLIFYVFYTIWYGFAVMFMFEGWGMRLEH